MKHISESWIALELNWFWFWPYLTHLTHIGSIRKGCHWYAIVNWTVAIRELNRTLSFWKRILNWTEFIILRENQNWILKSGNLQGSAWLMDYSKKGELTGDLHIYLLAWCYRSWICWSNNSKVSHFEETNQSKLMMCGIKTMVTTIIRYTEFRLNKMTLGQKISLTFHWLVTIKIKLYYM